MTVIPDDALGAVRWLAHRAITAERWQTARELLLGCVTIAPDDRWSALALAQVGLATSDPSLAQHAAALVLRHDPSDPHAALLYARASLALGQHDEARRWLDPLTTDLADALRRQLG